MEPIKFTYVNTLCIFARVGGGRLVLYSLLRLVGGGFLFLRSFRCFSDTVVPGGVICCGILRSSRGVNGVGNATVVVVSTAVTEFGPKIRITVVKIVAANDNRRTAPISHM